MLAIAFLVSVILARAAAKRQNINPDIIFGFAFVAFISGIIGGRIFYILENLSYYLKDPLETIMLQRGGLSWFGGLILAVIAGAIYLKRNKLAVFRIFDLVAPYLALAQAIGRIGCLLNGCCFGRTIIPTQIYSSLILIFIFIILRILEDRPHKDGQVFFAYLLLYSLKRFFIEFWRADNLVIFSGLTLFQILSVLIFILSLWGLFRLKKSKA